MGVKTNTQSTNVAPCHATRAMFSSCAPRVHAICCTTTNNTTKQWRGLTASNTTAHEQQVRNGSIQPHANIPPYGGIDNECGSCINHTRPKTCQLRHQSLTTEHTPAYIHNVRHVTMTEVTKLDGTPSLVVAEHERHGVSCNA
jgi:hypothetical protein